MTPRMIAILEHRAGSEILEELLDRTYGKDRGPQIPGHYGNCEPEDDEEEDDDAT